MVNTRLKEQVAVMTQKFFGNIWKPMILYGTAPGDYMSFKTEIC